MRLPIWQRPPRLRHNVWSSRHRHTISRHVHSASCLAICSMGMALGFAAITVPSSHSCHSRWCCTAHPWPGYLPSLNRRMRSLRLSRGRAVPSAGLGFVGPSLLTACPCDSGGLAAVLRLSPCCWSPASAGSWPFFWPAGAKHAILRTSPRQGCSQCLKPAERFRAIPTGSGPYCDENVSLGAHERTSVRAQLPGSPT